MKETRLIQTLFELIQLESLSKQEWRVAAYIKETLKGYAINIQEDDFAIKCNGTCGNLIVQIAGIGEPLLLDAHMDCVAPCSGVVPVIEGNRLTSDGTTILGGDDKVGVAILLELIHTIFQENLSCVPLTIVFSVCEEQSLQGVKHLNPSYYHGVKRAYILDGDGALGNVVMQTPFNCKGTFKIIGREAHAGVEPELGLHALVVLSNILQQQKIGRINKYTTFNIGTIKGGGARNVIMGNVEMEVEARCTTLKKLQAFIHQTTTKFEMLCCQQGAVFESTIVYGTKGYTLSENEDEVVFLRKQCEKLNIIYNGKICGGASNANIYSSHGMVALTLGIGVHNQHSLSEYVELVDVEKCFELVRELCCLTKSEYE